MLSEMYEAGERIADIAAALEVSENTIYKELPRGFTGKLDVNGRREYDPTKAQKAYQASLRNRGPAFAARAVEAYGKNA